jgi:hypothetical protein
VSELKNLSEDADELLGSYRPEELENVQSRIEEKVRAFERQHGLDSSEMKRRLEQGALRETWDVCLWLMHLHWLEDLRKERS